jgi:dihydropyrimidine dehydrogenase (NAD+) subunit PreA
MRQMTSGVDPRTGRAITAEKADWTTHPNNPARRG